MQNITVFGLPLMEWLQLMGVLVAVAVCIGALSGTAIWYAGEGSWSVAVQKQTAITLTGITLSVLPIQWWLSSYY